MILRPKQWQILTAVSLRNFKIRLIQHIRECFPREYAALGDPCTRVLVDLGVKLAQNHGFEGKRDICGFIDLMLIFGPDFDKDSKLPWVQTILEDSTLTSEAKMNKLLQKGGEVLAGSRPRNG